MYCILFLIIIVITYSNVFMAYFLLPTYLFFYFIIVLIVFYVLYLFILLLYFMYTICILVSGRDDRELYLFVLFSLHHCVIS